VTNAWLVVGLFAVHGVVYSFIQPAVDAHVATSSTRQNRARVQSMYAAIGMLGAFAGANALTKLYAIDYRLPLFTIGASYGICVLIGGLVIRRFEGRGRTMTSVTVSPLV
jgi:MFS family permease